MRSPTGRATTGSTPITELVTGQTPSTKSAKAFLGALTENKKVLVVIGRTDEVAEKSVRNLPGVHVISPDQLNTYDVLNADDWCSASRPSTPTSHAQSTRTTEEGVSA